MADWIFQGNPDRFDVDAYLSTHRYIYWTVATAQHQRQVQLGDRVFLWRAAGSHKAIAELSAWEQSQSWWHPKAKFNFRSTSGIHSGRARLIRPGK